MITIEKAIEKLSEDEAKEILLKYAKKNQSLKDIIILKFSKTITVAQKRKWERETDKIISRFGGDAGYIDYKYVYDFDSYIIDFLRERADLLINNGLLDDAYEFVCMIYKEISAIELIDPDSECEAEYICMEYFREILSKSDENKMRKMIDELVKIGIDTDVL